MEDWSTLQEQVPSGIPSWPDWIVIPLCMTMMAATVTWDVSQPPTVAGCIPYVVIVLIGSFSGRAWLTFFIALLSILLLLVGFYGTMDPAHNWENLINRAQTVAVIALLAGALIHRIRLMKQHEAALDRMREAVERLKVLHGILPICASCKMIRTDAGDWRQLEAYIQENSEAEFSHGICTDCAEKIYGELYAQDPEPGANEPVVKSDEI